MVSLCSNCLRDSTPNNTETPFTDNLKMLTIKEDPISKALANLQMKIKILEIQRNEATVKLKTVSDKDKESPRINNISSINNSQINSTNNHNLINALKCHQDSQDLHVKKQDDEQHSIQKSLAREALKMAEERCEKLECQLSTMKKLFLSKIVAKDHERKPKISGLEIKKDYVSPISDKFLENLSSESDSEYAFTLNEGIFENDLKNKSIENVDHLKKVDQPKNDQKMFNKRIPKPNYRKENSYPFVLGSSTSASHNLSVKNQITKKTKTLKMSPKKRMTTSADMNIWKNSINNLQTIYISLCKEYTYLFREKNNIIDSMGNFQEINKTEKMQKLHEIIELLHLKKKQIHKIQIMIKSMTGSKTDSDIYSNLTWNN